MNLKQEERDKIPGGETTNQLKTMKSQKLSIKYKENNLFPQNREKSRQKSRQKHSSAIYGKHMYA